MCNTNCVLIWCFISKKVMMSFIKFKILNFLKLLKLSFTKLSIKIKVKNRKDFKIKEYYIKSRSKLEHLAKLQHLQKLSND